MDFVRSYFFTNATLTSCPLFFILSSLLGGFAVAPTQKGWQNEKKLATGQNCIRKEVTSYKIHTLVTSYLHKNNSNFHNFFWITIYLGTMSLVFVVVDIFIKTISWVEYSWKIDGWVSEFIEHKLCIPKNFCRCFPRLNKHHLILPLTSITCFWYYL